MTAVSDSSCGPSLHMLENLASPHEVLRQMRLEKPVYRYVSPASGRTTWYVTRYSDVRRVLASKSLGRQAESLGDEKGRQLWTFDVDRDPLAMLRKNVFNLDPPDHGRLRRLLAPSFRGAALSDLMVVAKGLAVHLIEKVAKCDGTVDLMEPFLRFPSTVMAVLLGVPESDIDQVQVWSRGIRNGSSFAEVRAIGLELVSYLRSVVCQDRKEWRCDLMPTLLAARRGNLIGQDELVSSVFQLLFAGDETTANLLGIAIIELLSHPAELHCLRRNWGLIGNAVEEVIRFNGPVGRSRQLYALQDIRVGGQSIPRGDTVIPILLAANRDEQVYPYPETFDIRRQHVNHLGFGYGMHFCLGAQLAREQAGLLVSAIMKRFPMMELAAPRDELEWSKGLFVRGVRRLDVFPYGRLR